MILHKDKEEFRNAIEATAQHMGIREVYIEKDYWVSLVLKRLSFSEFKDQAIFKGGTSLSKALHCIERFSEDIDLAVITDDLSNNQVKKLISNIQKTITVDIPEIDMKNITSKGSKFRKTVHQYDKIVQGNDYGQATDKLLIEVNSFATPNPHSLMLVESYITTYLTEIKKDELVEKYQLESFDVNVLTINRTLVEKIMGLIRSCYSENPKEQLKKKIRHFYDIERILSRNGLKFLQSPDFFSMIDQVKIDDSNNHEFKGDWLEMSLSSCLLFKDIDEVWDEIKDVYIDEFRSFVFGEFPDAEMIKKSLMIVADRLKEYDVK